MSDTAIEWINHASYILGYGETKIICDPWLDGSVFNNGWSLLSKTAFKNDAFKSISHIWCSHEHPDHFNVPTLTRIDPAIRSQLIFLYQHTDDKLVYEFCRKLNFRAIIELKNDKWLNLTKKVRMLCGTHSGGDSWLYVQTPDCSVLNTNDCVLNNLQDVESVKSKTGSVDVLLTQFSYGKWEGNKSESHERRAAAEQKLRQMDLQLAVFKPKYVIPFASYIWFSHAENHFMNDETNRIDDIYQYLLQRGSAEPIVLYPGDKWSVGQFHDSLISIGKYASDYQRVINSAPLTDSKRVELETLVESARQFRSKVLSRLKKNLLLLALALSRPLKIYITDYRESFTFSLLRGLRKSKIDRDHNDIAMSSESLNYGFRSPFGFNTLHVNGRFEIPKFGNLKNFERYERLGYVINRGIATHDLLRAVGRRIGTYLRRTTNFNLTKGSERFRTER